MQNDQMRLTNLTNLVKIIHILYIIYFTSYTKKIDKNIPQNKIKQVFWGRSTELQEWKWIVIAFWTGYPEIKAVVLVKFGIF